MEPRNYGDCIQAAKADPDCLAVGGFTISQSPDNDLADKVFVYQPGGRAQAEHGLVVVAVFVRAHIGAAEWEQT